MTKVLVLGAGGMLGSMVARVLARHSELEVTRTAREGGTSTPDGLRQRRFDAQRDPIGALLDGEPCEWIVNTIGIIKPRIDPLVAASIETAVSVNALFPHRLAEEASSRGQRVIQIATDGVFSGANGPYDESAPHDALDVYGKTKSLGEVPASTMIHLRCSIIGPERGAPRSFLGWALSSPLGTRLSGYTEQRWNGITTLHFAKLCQAVIAGVEVPPLQHVVPADSVSKAEMLELVLAAFGRDDVDVRREPGPGPIDRTLTTRNPGANEHLWKAAGYVGPPTIADMLRELGAQQAEQLACAP